MNKLLYVIYAIALTILIPACEEGAPLSCGEWIPECEMQKDYICFQYLGDPTLATELQPIDVLGSQLQPNRVYVTSTRLKAPVPILNSDVFNALISTGNGRLVKYSLPMEYGSAGTATEVNLLLTGDDQIRGSLTANIWIEGHKGLGQRP